MSGQVIYFCANIFCRYDLFSSFYNVSYVLIDHNNASKCFLHKKYSLQEEIGIYFKRRPSKAVLIMQKDTKFKKSETHTSRNTNTGFAPDSALALIKQVKLSKYHYEISQKATKEIGHDIFPYYRKVIEAKKTMLTGHYRC